MPIMIRTIEWTGAGVVMLDQKRLPVEEIYHTYNDYEGVAEAIRSMIIRGAPAIGVAAAMGLALGVKNAADKSPSIEELDREFETMCSVMAATRPTAVNLFWAIDRMKAVYARVRPNGTEAIKNALVDEAAAAYREDIEANRAMGRAGQELIRDGARILTH